jgi:gamma-glutamyltranspeptidase / glutathione hydrolase
MARPLDILPVLVAAAAVAALMPIAEAGAQQAGGQQRPTTLAGRSVVHVPNGAIATSHPLATAAGQKALQDGGNAIDAAVTAAAVLAVVEPHMVGIGGDLFAIIWSAREQRLAGLNASGRSGSLMTLEELRRRGHQRVPLDGAEAVTVPGAISGYAALLERYGTLTLAQALAPAIAAAEQGFPVTPIIASDWAQEVARLQRDDAAAATFLVDGGRAPRAGEWFRNADLAASLRGIAEHGPAYLYGGTLGRRIAEHVQRLGGFVTTDDFAAHRPSWIEPMSVPFRGYRLWELPPNGQGIAALQMLRILDGYDLTAMGHNSAPYLHHLIEAKKLAYADLDRHVADPAFMRMDPDALLADAFIAARRAQLDPRRAAEHVQPGDVLTASETIYLAASDADGNMVSLISSIYYAFGSGVVAPGTGITLQNRGAGFTMTDGLPNTVAPGKLPFHTIIPAFVTRTSTPAGVTRGSAGEEPWLAFGVMGGAMQPQGHVQLLLNMLVFGMDVQQAIDAPRFRHLDGLRVAIESPVDDDVRAALRALGHDIVSEGGVSFGGAQAVLRLPRGWAAGSDPRKDGHAGGH